MITMFYLSAVYGNLYFSPIEYIVFGIIEIIIELAIVSRVL